MTLAMQKLANLCHFLPSCRGAKWLCRCKQHDVFAANTDQFFVRFPSQGVFCNICLCLRSKCSKGPLHRIGHNAKISMLRPLPLWIARCHLQSTIVQPAAPGSCPYVYVQIVTGLWVPNVSMPPKEYELCSLTNMDY
jgi:hypothetical protein